MNEGQNIGHYTIIRQLGKGGMGEVYLAEDTKLKREVAIKVLPERLRSNEERLRRFRREAEAAAKLNHQNIATIFALEDVDMLAGVSYPRQVIKVRGGGIAVQIVLRINHHDGCSGSCKMYLLALNLHVVEGILPVKNQLFLGLL